MASKSLWDVPVVLGLEHGVSFITKEDWGIEEWLQVNYYWGEDLDRYPNAKKAYEIKQTDLYKALE